MILLATSHCVLQEGGPSPKIFPRLVKMFYLLDLRWTNQNHTNTTVLSPHYFQPGEPQGVRPKRQRPRPPHSDQYDSEKSMNNGLPEEDLGFFNEVSFPDIGEFGLGWDPQKVRRKREAREFPYYYEQQQRRPPAPRRQRQHGQRQFSRPPPASHSNRRKGPGGFWDDPDFDADFFSGGGPQSLTNFDSYTNNKYQQQQPRPQQHSYYPQQQPRPQYPETPRAYRPRPQPKPQRPKIKPTRVSHC